MLQLWVGNTNNKYDGRVKLGRKIMINNFLRVTWLQSLYPFMENLNRHGGRISVLGTNESKRKKKKLARKIVLPVN